MRLRLRQYHPFIIKGLTFKQLTLWMYLTLKVKTVGSYYY